MKNRCEKQWGRLKSRPPLKLAALGLGLIWCVGTPLMGQLASVSGRVIGEDGRGIAGAVVSVVRKPVPDILRSGPPVEAARTNTDGSFVMKGLPMGSYRLCAQTPAREWLGPCEWETSKTEVAVGNRQIRSGVEIRMQRGHVVKFRVEDDGETIRQNLGKKRGASLVFGYRSGNQGMEVKVPYVVTAKVREYQFSVPFDTEVRLVVAAKNLQLEDGTGKALGDGFEVPVRTPKQGAAGPVAVVVKVRGLKN